MSSVEKAFATPAAWVDYLDHVDIPILRRSRVEIERLAERDDADLQGLCRIAYHDALLALRILLYQVRHRSRHQITEVATLERAILMAGVNPLQRDALEAPVVEDLLATQPEACLAVLGVLQRSYHAGGCAQFWADQRHDIDTKEVATAALLSSIAEILLGCFAPKLLLQIRARLQADSTVRSLTAQTEVLGFPGLDIQLALVEYWALPRIMHGLMDEENLGNQRTHTVLTAAAFTRHVANGWDDAALLDDYIEIANLLDKPLETAKPLVIAHYLKASADWNWFFEEDNRPPPPVDYESAN